jgi:hypothetical protein
MKKAASTDFFLNETNLLSLLLQSKETILMHLFPNGKRRWCAL